MLLIPPANHNGLIVVTLWQNNLDHPSIDLFEAETRTVIENAKNLSFDSVTGTALPRVTLEYKLSKRRLASWVTRLEQPENANELTKRLQNNWIGRHQGASIRRLDVGNAHQRRMNYKVVHQVRSAGIYSLAYKELKRRECAAASSSDQWRIDCSNNQSDEIVSYLWSFLTQPIA